MNYLSHKIRIYPNQKAKQYLAKCFGTNQQLMIADRFYPSSKLCSVCGKKNKDLQLKDREWTCNFCGTVHDRDVNAAKNLAAVAVGHTETKNACRESL